MHLPKPQHNPYAIRKNIQRILAAEPLNRTPPIWSPALALFPPAPFHPVGVVPAEVGQFTESPSALADRDKSLRYRQVRHRNWTTKSKRMEIRARPNAARYFYTPPVIEYPEDEIRKEFYEEHPFELKRPRVVVESEETLRERDWSDVRGGLDVQELTGESVVQHALHLMQRPANPLPRSEAYRTALTHFYRLRAQQDLLEQAARDHAEKEAIDAAAASTSTTTETATSTRTGSEYDRDRRGRFGASANTDPKAMATGRPWTAKMLEWEQEQIVDSDVFRRARDQERQTRRAMQDKAQQFERRNAPEGFGR